MGTKEIRPLLRETLGVPFTLVPITDGLLNQNVLVTTGDGAKFVFKAYRLEMPRAKVDEMHRVMRHVSRRGIPVALPVSTYEVAGVAAALYPFVEGAHPPRYGMGVKRAEVLGDMLGRVDAALDLFRPVGKKPTSLEIANWDPAKMTAEIAVLRASLRGKSRTIRETVEGVLRMHESILSKGDWDAKPFATLPVRVCHNDYHTQNVLMRGNAVATVLDWEKTGWEWRGFEVARSVMFTCRRSNGTYCWDNVRAYLGGYKRHAALSDAERELAFACGFNKAFFSLWAVKQYVAGRAEMCDHLLRRAKLIPYLFAHRDAFSERIAALLA